MRFAHFAAAVAILTASPAHAANWSGIQQDSRIGAFAGVRINLKLGGQRADVVRTSVAISPVHTSFSGGRAIQSRIGQGVGVEFSARRARATIAGMPVQQALGLARQDGSLNDKGKLGVSSGGWAAIGAGVAVVAGAIWFASEVNKCEDHDDECA